MKNEMLAKAKAGLILDQPFFASLLLAMPFVEDNSIATMATDGETIRYNTKFMDGLTLQELTFVLAHETLHCVFQHMFRRGEKNHNKWNIAADYVINEILVTEKVGTMPKGALKDTALVQKGGATAEGVYALLPKETENKKPGQKGGALDDISEPSQDPAELAKKEADMRVRIVQAKNAAKMQGKLSAGIDRLVNEMTKSVTDWRTVLRRFLTERAKSELSYARPKRRFLAEDLSLPSLIGEKLGAVVIAVDCSGSIGEVELSVFEAEVSAVLDDAKPSEVKVIYFDSEVLKTETFAQDDLVKLTPVGGGGTAFSPIFDEVNNYETAPVAVVVLTDLCCSDFGDAPAYPVLWASTVSAETESVPFGDVITIKAD